MKKQQKAAEAAQTNETKAEKMPSKTPVEISGKTYDLCFDFAELAQAEQHFRRQGHNVRLMFSLPELTLDGVRDAFPCLIHTFRPDMSFEDAQALVDMQSVYPIATAIVQALNGKADKAGVL